MDQDCSNITSDKYIRTQDEVNQFIEHAKLNVEDLASVTQTLYFADKFEDYKLLELNSDVQEAFKEGQNVVFRGGKEKKAVLCTDSLTFELLEAETSNSSLLIPDLNVIGSTTAETGDTERYIKERTIDGIFHSYFELRKIKSAFLKELEALLNTCLYSGPENEYIYEVPSSKSLYTTEDLLNICQANIVELKEALNSLGACSIDGYWRLLDFNFHLRVLTVFINLVSSNSWTLLSVPESETIDTLSDIFPRVIAEHIFSQYTKPTYERNDEGDALFSLIEDKICRFLGEALLRDGAGMDYDLRQFLEAWNSSVPEDMDTDICQLEGIAVVVENNGVSQIKLCVEKELSRNIDDRIKHLFTIKKRWTLDELSPYIKPLLSDKVNIKSFIMKYANEIVLDGTKFFVQRT